MRRNSLFIMLLLAVLLPITISAQQIFQVPVYFWNDVILEQGFVTGESANGADVKFWGATAGNYVLYDASEDLFTVVQTNDNTSGTEVGATVTLTQTGAGAISEGFYSKVIADVQTGSWVNGIVGRVDYSTGSTGDAGGGMAAAICAELNLPARTPSGGAYYAIDLEIEAPENFSSLTSPTTRPMAFMRTGLWGNTTAAADWEDYGYIFHFDDINDLTGNVWYDNTLRVLVNTTAFYIPLSDAQGEYSSAYPIDISNATNSTSPTVGSIQTDGGLGVVLDLYVDGTSNLDNTDIDGTFAADGTTFDVNSTTTVTIDNTNTSNGVVINAVTSGSPISIGHTTSETTVNDNLSVTGDLAVELVANLDNTDIDGTITADGTAFDFNATSTFTMDNTNTTNGIDINTGTDGSPVDIGHSNSEVGIGDNLTVSGDADVVGALTGNTIASDATVVAASTMSTGANSGTSGQITFIASDNDQGTVTINTSDNLTFAGFTGGVDVNGDFTTGTIESDANVTGVTGIFTQTAEGVSLDIGYSATAQVTATGIIDVVRTGDMTGIDAEVYSDINILPDWTFTEPGGGETTTIYGVNIDMTSMETTAGDGTSIVAALNLVADTDGDAGTQLALQISGNTAILDDNTLRLGSTDGVATRILLEFDETTTGIGQIQLGTSATPMVLNTNPGGAVNAIEVNVTHSAGAGDGTWQKGVYSGMIISGTGDSGSSISAVNGSVNSSGAMSSAYAGWFQATHASSDDITGAMAGINVDLYISTSNFEATQTLQTAIFTLRADQARTVTCTSENFNMILIKNQSALAGLYSMIKLSSAGADDPEFMIAFEGSADNGVFGFESGSNCVADTGDPGAAGNGGTAAATHKIKCEYNGTTFYIAGWADF